MDPEKPICPPNLDKLRFRHCYFYQTGSFEDLVAIITYIIITYNIHKYVGTRYFAKTKCAFTHLTNRAERSQQILVTRHPPAQPS